MTVRDLGYRGYDGERLPSSHNAVVLFRYGLTRAWSSWLVKIGCGLAIFPPMIAAIMLWVTQLAAKQTGQAIPAQAASTIEKCFTAELWLAVTLITLGAGASAIADDFSNRSFQFYFSKPVTAEQYLFGRTLAIAALIFMVTMIPALFVLGTVIGFDDPANRLDDLGASIPALIFGLILATSMAALSVGISALSKSRALTMSAWLLVFIVPHLLGTLIASLSHWEWIRLASIPSLLTFVSNGLFKTAEPKSVVHWYHAAPLLAALVVAALAWARERVFAAEVIT